MKTEKDVMRENAIGIMKDAYAKLEDLRLASNTPKTKRDKLWYVRNEVRNAINRI